MQELENRSSRDSLRTDLLHSPTDFLIGEFASRRLIWPFVSLNARVWHSPNSGIQPYRAMHTSMSYLKKALGVHYARRQVGLLVTVQQGNQRRLGVQERRARMAGCNMRTGTIVIRGLATDKDMLEKLRAA